MKGLDPLISTFLVIVITITAIALVFQLGNPSIGRAQEILLLEEGKRNIFSIDNAVKNVLQEGQGSTRVVTITVSDGSYIVNSTSDSIVFIMDSKSQIIDVGVTQVENNIQISGSPRMITLNLTYESLDIIDGGILQRSSNRLTVSNTGFNSTSNKQSLSINL